MATLYVYPSFLDLLSLDPQSLQFIAITRFCAADVKLVPVRRASECPSGKVPCYVDHREGVVIGDFVEFVEFMRNTDNQILIDRELTSEQRLLSIAYIAMVHEKLIPALNYLFWLDECNYSCMTQPAYTNVLGFPYYLVFMHCRRNAMTAHIKALKKQPKDLMDDAVKVLNALSIKLGESKYFNGTKPSSLDAFLFGHLAPLFKLPLANEQLKQHLESQPNLCIYLENISSIYMPLDEKQLCTSRQNRIEIMPIVEKTRKAMETQRNNERIKKAEKAKQEVDSKQNVILFGIVTVALSLAFAVHAGIIRESFFLISIRQKVARKRAK